MQRRSSRLSHSVIAGVAASTLLAGAALAATGTRGQQKNTPSFEPVPQQVTIQRFDVVPELGDTKVVMSLDRSEVQRLESETGRKDILLVGPIGGRTMMRDDGQFPDDIAGDRDYTGFAFTSDEEILRRASHNVNIVQGVTEHFVFDGRTLAGTEPTSPFDVNGFFEGEPVNLEPLEPAPDEPFPDDPVPTGPIGPVLGTNSFQDRVLMITHPGVVTDPLRTVNPCSPGTSTSLPAWSFGRLMSDIANQPVTGIHPGDFAEDWMEHWLTNQLVNSFNVAARPLVQSYIDEWRARSGGGRLDMRQAPFRLLAIVNRTDLRQTTTSGGGYGGSSGTNFLNAGEGRFVFALVDRRGGGCSATPYNVILEYGVPLDTCTEVRDWATDWSSLASLTPGTSTYNTRLQQLTDVFALANANPAKPNRSAINQVRTNENELNPLWELREFRLLDPTPSLLSQTTVAETPDDVFRTTNRSAINSFLASAVGGGSVPLIHPTLGTPFLGGASENPFSPFNVFWDGNPSLGGSSARHNFSLNTCNGCHGGETDTFFVHIDPGVFGGPLLSGFLTGITVTDPVDSSITRVFDDLARRESDLASVRGLVCSTITPIEEPVLEPDPCLIDCPTLDPQMHFAAPQPVDISFDEFLTPPVEQVH